MKFDKVNKIVKYAANTIDDYYRLQIIENWISVEPLDDKKLSEYLTRMNELMPQVSGEMSPGDLAFILCAETNQVSLTQIQEKYYA